MGKYLLKEVSKHSKGEPEYIKKNKRLYLKDMAFLISIAIMEETVMKRRAVKSVLCAALMALTLSMTACGGSDDAAKDAATEEQEEASEEEAEEPEEEKAAEATANTLEEYLNSTDGAMEAVEEQIAGSNGDGMSVSGEVKGNDFTFNFTIEDASLITDDTAAQLEAGLDATASVFEEMAGQMDDEVGLDRGSIQVVIKYCDPDGNVLAERGFKAQ